MKADDQTILALHTRVITHNPRITVSHDNNLRTWQLRIRQLKESDRGCYMCQINTGEMKKQYGCIDVHGQYFLVIWNIIHFTKYSDDPNIISTKTVTVKKIADQVMNNK